MSHSNSLSNPVNDFSFSLFDRLAVGHENTFVSPLSVTIALSMLMLGARNNSANQLFTGLKFDHLNDDGKKNVHKLIQKERIQNDESLKLANYVLIQKLAGPNDVLDKYRRDLQSFYAAKVDDVSFASEGARIVSLVNNWIKENTNGLIEEILDSPPDPSTRLVLLNAIYFKGKWETAFNRTHTRRMPFLNSGRNAKETEFMTMRDGEFVHLKTNVSGKDVRVVELPYKDEKTSMVIVLPDQKDGMHSLMSSASGKKELLDVIDKISGIKRPSKIDIFLPKFHMETDYTLNQVLKEMGMTDVFAPQSADLSGIAGTRDLFVSYVKHKAVVKVDEEGTEAAAVTSVGIEMTSIRQPTVFKADHPFLFVIKDRQTGLILFMGKVEKFD